MIKKVMEYIRHPQFFLIWLDARRIITLKDDVYLKILYQKVMKRKLNLENPQRFTEKLQWLKLNDRKEIYSKLVDKYEVKDYIAKVVGKEYVIPTYGVWNQFKDINFNNLPNEFVLKCTHDSGSFIICKNKEKLDQKYANKKLNKSLKRKYFYTQREWPYKNVKPRIIAEKLLRDNDLGEVLTDYKFFCFNGKAKIMYISKDIADNPTTDFFDMEFNHLDIRMKDKNAKILPKKPEQFEKMKEIAEKLSKGIPHLRVDFYIVEGKIYVGELTFFHLGGFFKIHPDYWDEKIGKYLILPYKEIKMSDQ